MAYVQKSDIERLINCIRGEAFDRPNNVFAANDCFPVFTESACDDGTVGSIVVQALIENDQATMSQLESWEQQNGRFGVEVSELLSYLGIYDVDVHEVEWIEEILDSEHAGFTWGECAVRADKTIDLCF